MLILKIVFQRGDTPPQARLGSARLFQAGGIKVAP